MNKLVKHHFNVRAKSVLEFMEKKRRESRTKAIKKKSLVLSLN